MTQGKTSILQHFTNDGKVENLARFVWPGHGAVIIEPLVKDGSSGAEELVRNGIHGRDNRLLTPADGEAFIDELPFAISGDRIWATRVDLLQEE